MRVAVYSDFFAPELSGVSDSVLTTGAALARRGHRIDFYVPRYAARDARPGRDDPGPNMRVIRRGSLPCPGATGQSRAALPSLLSWLRMQGRTRPDVIHVHTFSGMGLEGLLTAALLRVPVVGTNHTSVAGFAPHLPVGLQTASAYVLWFYNRCCCVTAPSRSVFDELGAGRLRPPLRVVSNPIDTVLFCPAAPGRAAALKAEFGLPPMTVTYAGRMGPEKNIEVLIRAVALLAPTRPELCLVLAGHGTHEPALRGLAAELGVTGHVRFPGSLDHAALARLLQASDAFAMMSTSETQSMALLQAMACGLPVLAADSRALPEFVAADNGILLPPDDPATLAASLVGLLGAPERRHSLGAHGRRRAEVYGVEAIADQWEAIYQSARAGSQQPRNAHDQFCRTGIQ